jgi:6-phosphogluconolactonase
LPAGPSTQTLIAAGKAPSINSDRRTDPETGAPSSGGKNDCCKGKLTFIGTHLNRPSKSLYSVCFDERSGRFSALTGAAEIDRPTWIVAHPTLPLLYSVSEVGNDGSKEASVITLAVDRLTCEVKVIDQAYSGGRGATHLALDSSSQTLFVANFGDGQVSALPMDSDGSLGPVSSMYKGFGSGVHPVRQLGPHAHGVVIDPTLQFVLVADLGSDRIFIYRFNSETRKLTPAQPAFVAMPPGSGPRHLVFHQKGEFLFVLAEMTAQVWCYRWDAQEGHLHFVQSISALPEGFTGFKSAAEIAMADSGRYLYVSTRGDSSIVAFSVDQCTGRLTEIQRVSSQGDVPWSFTISPSGLWMIVANEASNSLAVLRLDPDTGKISSTEEKLTVPQPVSITFFRH